VTRDHAGRVLRALHAAQAAFYAGDRDEAALREILTDDVRWHVPGRNAIAGTYEGIGAVLEYFARRGALATQSFRMHPGDLLVGDGDRVAALTDGTATIVDRRPLPHRGRQDRGGLAAATRPRALRPRLDRSTDHGEGAARDAPGRRAR
jgi:hypothetical protein